MVDLVNDGYSKNEIIHLILDGYIFGKYAKNEHYKKSDLAAIYDDIEFEDEDEDEEFEEDELDE